MESKPLTDNDFGTGMIFERKLAAAHEAFVAANTAYKIYMDVLRERYNAPADEWELTDWAEGFVRGNNGKQNDQ